MTKRLTAVLATWVLVCGAGGAYGQERAPAKAFYVDPDWQGERSGSAGSPWTRVDPRAWREIDRALAGSDVVVYFSARDADADRNQLSKQSITILRTDPSTHRVTLDGMSKYNADDASPKWLDNRGGTRHEIHHHYPVGAFRGQKRNYVTIRGFKTVAGYGRGGQGVVYWGGDHVVIEHCEVTKSKDVKHGPGIIFGYAWNADGTAKNGGCVDLVIRNNVVHHTFGEGIYIGGSQDVNRPAHRDVLIEGNVVYDVAAYGGEGDAIDIKDGSSNVIVRGNTLYMTKPGAGRDGIAMSSGGIIEGNFIYNFGRDGITLGTYWNAHACRKGTVVRNNIIVNTGGNPNYSWDYGIKVGGGAGIKPDHGSEDQYDDLAVYNNTVVGVRGDRKREGVGLDISRFATGAKVTNNLIVNSAFLNFLAGPDCLAEHDYNLFHSTTGGLVARYGSQTFTAETLKRFEPHSLSVDPKFVNPSVPYAPEGFRLHPTSPAVGAGVKIDTFDADFFGTKRGGRWDIGAIQTKNP
ncbi:MAG: hypothetical protein AMS16_07310 [Planctomycetes bacterium DG_58]|nr:MAG: hypothetical protein AMS16_07310 [Planctomycetes bacterium DG_58]